MNCVLKKFQTIRSYKPNLKVFENDADVQPDKGACLFIKNCLSKKQYIKQKQLFDVDLFSGLYS